MKGPNPFAAYDDSIESVCGRKDEHRIFSSFMQGAAAAQAGLLLIRGGPGSGKSTLMGVFRQSSEKAGMTTPFAKAEKGQGFEDLMRILQSEIGGSSAMKSTLDALMGLAARKSRGSAAMIFIDDLDRMRKPEEALGSICERVKSGWGRGKVAFVISTARPLGVESDIITVMELQPFDEHDAHEMIEKALGKGPPKMGEECLGTMLADTGGNPRLLKSVCRYVYERLKDNEKVITKSQYLVNMQHVMSMLSREWFGGIYQETPDAERRILGELAKSDEGIHVSDIARKLGKPLGPVTALTRRLMDSGQIVRVGRGKYRIFSKLYGRYVAQRA